MNFAIKVGDKYLVDLDCLENNRGITGHTQFVYIPGGLTLRFEDEPEYFSRVTTSNRVNNILDLMRWGDIPLDLIKIIPEEVLNENTKGEEPTSLQR